MAESYGLSLSNNFLRMLFCLTNGGSEELNYNDVLEFRVRKATKGYQKLVDACRIARGLGLEYLWIDTCCIDKKSSAELSESINSMYSWYEKAQICLAYLEDVHSISGDAAFTKSVWFTRSRTLQELIAPERLIFYNTDWVPIGERHIMTVIIEGRTSIPEYILCKEVKLSDYTIVERMSWACGRNATRPEDVAYGLMGLFDVNMPLLYGEGEKAFTRLQEEIIRQSCEPTFLFWGLDSPAISLPASSPADFVDFKV